MADRPSCGCVIIHWPRRQAKCISCLSIAKPDEHEAAYTGKEVDLHALTRARRVALGWSFSSHTPCCIAKDFAAGSLDQAASLSSFDLDQGCYECRASANNSLDQTYLMRGSAANLCMCRNSKAEHQRAGVSPVRL